MALEEQGNLWLIKKVFFFCLYCRQMFLVIKKYRMKIKVPALAGIFLLGNQFKTYLFFPLPSLVLRYFTI